MKRTLISSAVLVVAVFAAYWPVGAHEFVNFDDHTYVYANPMVRRGLTAEGIAYAFTTGDTANWHPITWLSLMLDAELFGADRAGPLLLVSVTIHALNALLLLYFLRLATGSFWRATLVAGLFALHPLRVESVAWISERKDVLSTTFWMLTMLAYYRYVRQPSSGRYALVLVALALGLLTKPMLVTMPFVLLVLDVWPLRRWRPFDGEPHRWKALALEKLPLLALVAVASAVTFVVQRAGGAVTSTSYTGIGERVVNAFASYWIYAWQTVWPSGLVAFYPHPVDLPGSHEVELAALGVVAIAAGATFAWRHARTAPYGIVGLCWYLGTLVPVIGIVQVGRHAHADRYTYVPTIGLYLAAVWGIAAWVRTRQVAPVVVRAACALLLVVLATLTHLQSRTWADSETLWRHALAVIPDNHVAHSYLGRMILRQQRERPPGPERQRALQEATRHIQRALELATPDDDVTLAAATLDFEAGRIDAAREKLLLVAERNPLGTTAEYLLGVIASSIGDERVAVRWFERATRARSPTCRADANFNLGLMAMGERDLARATRLYRAALEADPTHAPSHNGLGAAGMLAGDHAAAIRHLRQAAQLGSLEAANNLAWLLATARDPELRDGDEAVAWATECVAGEPGGNPIYLQTLAAAHAERGEFGTATRLQREALSRAPPARVPQMREFLALFEAGRPVRQ